ncbi:hypothetical protein [Rubinisphaera sp. JC750]|uniref:hypothetical protein n=1 Tax=Rubinisphaera sp. JC750 TaxID=2898658 RepID=UPI001F2B6B6F|nr:hypothetical protein [Rubinisphaera sp. JC750]
MISSLGRVLAVLVAMFSVAFMAFAISRWATVPDWASEAREMEDFRITRTEGETPSWSAVTRRTGETVATSPNVAEVLEKMYQRATQDTQAEIQQYETEVPILEGEIEEAKVSVAADDIGVQNRVNVMVARLEEMEAEVQRLTSESERQKALAQKLQQERERRRSDVYRTREELAEAREDTFRAEQLQKELTDMIRRVEGSVVKLQTRQQQLKESLQ